MATELRYLLYIFVSAYLFLTAIRLPLFTEVCVILKLINCWFQTGVPTPLLYPAVSSCDTSSQDTSSLPKFASLCIYMKFQNDVLNFVASSLVFTNDAWSHQPFRLFYPCKSLSVWTELFTATFLFGTEKKIAENCKKNVLYIFEGHAEKTSIMG